MNTTRVTISYRPLRIAWAIRDGDMAAFRRAVRLSHALWGGRFNCIVVVDRAEEARQLVDLFRADAIIPLGATDEVRAFPSQFTHIVSPFYRDAIFGPGSQTSSNCEVLDVHNLFHYLHRTGHPAVLEHPGIVTYAWSQDDPLSDIFLIALGAYPDPIETRTDYASLITEAFAPALVELAKADPVPASILEHTTIASLSAHGLTPHYSVPRGRASPGFFVGNAASLVDLVAFWNLRAAGVPLWFLDLNHLDRYAELLHAWESHVRQMVLSRHQLEQRLAVWTPLDINAARRPFGDTQVFAHPVSSTMWNGLNVRAPTMHFGEASSLGILGNEHGTPKVSFAMADKPFSDDSWFHGQRLIASVSCLSGLLDNDHFTFQPPFVPELNVFYSRAMRLHPYDVRSESERIGILMGATQSDTFLIALSVTDLMAQVFRMGQFSARPNPAGRIATQVIARLGGLQGARVLKIPGVRRLLKTHGPTSAFTAGAAFQLIGGRDPANPQASFADHKGLFIEQREPTTQLTPQAAFGYLVARGLFHIGIELTCPACQLSSWIALDDLEQHVTCNLCGHEWNATRQLMTEPWRYRRSGALGIERNALGAIPVVLTLQQLDANLYGAFVDHLYSTALDMIPVSRPDALPCEVDFVWMIVRSLPRRTAVILGECKDHKDIDATTIADLKRCADGLPAHRFKTFIVLSKLSAFTAAEIEHAKSLNDCGRQRVIMLTSEELEPFHIYDRAAKTTSDPRAGSPEDLAQATAEIYFAPPRA